MFHPCFFDGNFDYDPGLLLNGNDDQNKVYPPFIEISLTPEDLRELAVAVGDEAMVKGEDQCMIVNPIQTEEGNNPAAVVLNNNNKATFDIGRDIKLGKALIKFD